MPQNILRRCLLHHCNRRDICICRWWTVCSCIPYRPHHPQASSAPRVCTKKFQITTIIIVAYLQYTTLPHASIMSVSGVDRAHRSKRDDSATSALPPAPLPAKTRIYRWPDKCTQSTTAYKYNWVAYGAKSGADKSAPFARQFFSSTISCFID